MNSDGQDCRIPCLLLIAASIDPAWQFGGPAAHCPSKTAIRLFASEWRLPRPSQGADFEFPYEFALPPAHATSSRFPSPAFPGPRPPQQGGDRPANWNKIPQRSISRASSPPPMAVLEAPAEGKVLTSSPASSPIASLPTHGGADG